MEFGGVESVDILGLIVRPWIPSTYMHPSISQDVGSYFWAKSGSVFAMFEIYCQLMSKFEAF